jgi:hypothetical protein
MATFGNTVLNLLDMAKRMDPNGKAAMIAELLNETNDILADMLWMEGNLPTGHQTTVRTGLPAVTWRLLNGGVLPSKSTSAQLAEACGMLEAYSQLDIDVAKLAADVNQARLGEAKSFVESMNQNMAQTLFYGDTTVNPERFLGLAARFNTISGAVNGSNVISAAGSGSVNTSVWLVGWGENTVCGIYPKGSQAGLFHEDLGVETVTVVAGNGAASLMRAYRDHWQWKCGIALKDWRYVVRLCNIDTTDLKGSSGTENAQQLINFMSRMIDRVPAYGGIKPVFYCNRTLFSMLRIQALAKSQNAIAIEPGLGQFGSPMKPGTMSFFGIPIRRVDQLLNNEATIS